MEKFDFETYRPINYKNWILGDKAREGINVKRLNLLNKEELNLFNLAIPFQDQRDDPGQGEIVTYFTLEFLKYYPGDRKIAVPAAILHDIGFYGTDPSAWKKLVDKAKGNVEKIRKTTDTEEKRRPHQNRGALLAGRLLERTNWPEKYNNEIADIIGDHDTRKLPTTENGEIVRAADLLWRITLPQMEIYHQNKSPEKILAINQGAALYMEPPRALREIELKIGEIETVNSLFFKFHGKSEKILRESYPRELEKIIEFYRNN